ncbi:MAG TPA: hypothetical protein VJ184_15750, partial [Chryseolinea sp.]|nr:hypothetical protein [Chryseolinea sp.]
MFMLFFNVNSFILTLGVHSVLQKMEMRLQHIEPHPQLIGYVSKIWVFESSGRVPSDDMKLIVPNGMVKITIPFRNGVSGKNKEGYHLSKESQITLIGMGDTPAVVDIEHD